VPPSEPVTPPTPEETWRREANLYDGILDGLNRSSPFLAIFTPGNKPYIPPPPPPPPPVTPPPPQGQGRGTFGPRPRLRANPADHTAPAWSETISTP
jgi:hypothetical protein